MYLAGSTGSTRRVDFSKFNEEWDYNAHRFEDAADSVEAVRKKLMKFPRPHVVVVGLRGFKYCLSGRHKATKTPKLSCVIVSTDHRGFLI